MAQLVKPGEVKIITRDGELLISLQIDLNINLNQSGSVVVEGGVQATHTNVTNNSTVENEDSSWLIPDFKPAEKIKFGK